MKKQSQHRRSSRRLANQRSAQHLPNDGAVLVWEIGTIQELLPGNRDVRAFRCRVQRDQVDVGAINLAVDGQTLSKISGFDLPSTELGMRLAEHLVPHLGWLIKTGKFPRQDQFLYEIRWSDRSPAEHLQAPSTRMLPLPVPLGEFHFPPPITASIDSIEIAGLFGFGATQTLKLSPTLTVGVGENGSGKSSVRKLLESLKDLSNGERPFEREINWEHQSIPSGDGEPVTSALKIKSGPMTYSIGFEAGRVGAAIRNELLESTYSEWGTNDLKNYTELRRPGRGFDCEFTQRIGDTENWYGEAEIAGPCDVAKAVLSTLGEVWLYPAAASLKHTFSQIRTYSAWDFCDAKTISKASFDPIQTALSWDGSNLKSIVGRFQSIGDDSFDRWFEQVMRYEPKLRLSGTSLVYEHVGRELGVSDLSDGSLRWAQTVAALHSEGSLLVLDEPELGLHPDLIVSLAELLLERSKLLPILVFTHSKDLLSALDNLHTEHGEQLNVQILEQDVAGNTIQSPNLAELRERYPAEEYPIGKLWSQGQIGGNRW